MSHGVPPPVRTTFLDATTFFAGSLATKTTLFPMNIESLAFCSGLNAFSIAAVNYLDTSYHKTTLTLAGLVLGTTLACIFAKPLAATRINIIISPLVTAQLACFHLVVKTGAYAAYQIANNYYQNLSFGKFKTTQDLHELSESKIGSCKTYFEINQTIWDALPLKMQAAFNVLLEKSGLSSLLFTNFTSEDLLSQDELKIFFDSLGKTLTDKQFQVLLRHKSTENIQLFHQLLLKTPKDLSPKQHQVFAKYFYAESLPPLTAAFLPNLSIPSSATSITPVQALYYQKSYERDSTSLSLNEQIILNVIIAKCGTPLEIRDPELGEIPDLCKDGLEMFRERYEDQSEEWQVKGTSFQKAFNHALIDHGMKPIPISNEPMPTWQKVGIVGGVLFLLIGAVAGAFYMQQDHQESTPAHNQTASTHYQQPTAFPHDLDQNTLFHQHEFFQMYSQTSASPTQSNALALYHKPIALELETCAFRPPDHDAFFYQREFLPQTSAPRTQSNALALYHQPLAPELETCAFRPPDHNAFFHQREFLPQTSAPATQSNALTLYHKPITLDLGTCPPPQPHSFVIYSPPANNSFFPSLKWIGSIIGIVCIWIGCGKKKQNNSATFELDQGVDPNEGFETEVKTFPSWSQEAVKAISLDQKVGRQYLPSSLVRHTYKVEFSAGGTAYSEDTNEATLKSLPEALKFISSRPGWQGIAKTVAYVALQIIPNTFGPAEDINFTVTKKDGAVQLVINTQVAGKPYRANIGFNKMKNLENLSADTFDIKQA